ncbi:unnamed protein product [Ambrosiozyma monospora]|uniref:Unnamed protein product n=1 Tax=Ambrosiozyma monospora TaxID=43982 RepID=A0A9W6YUV2_AMBMO|nr:unnamed protein product [Ambrosiozyma monospora]
MSSNNFSISTVLDLPQEIRHIISMNMANDFNSFISSEGIFSYTTGSALEFEAMMHQLLSMSNNPILDDLLSDIVQQLVLNEIVFESQYFEAFADYVLSKKIKVRSVTIGPGFYVTDRQPKLLDFFKLGTEELITTYTDGINKMTHAKFITSLDVFTRDLRPDFSASKLKCINELPNLTRLHYTSEPFPAFFVSYEDEGEVEELFDSIEYAKSWSVAMGSAYSEDQVKKRKLDKPRKLKVDLIIRGNHAFKPELISQLKYMLSDTSNPNMSLELQVESYKNYPETTNALQTFICGLQSVKRFNFVFESLEDVEFVNRIVGLKDLHIWGSDDETESNLQIALCNSTVENLTLDWKYLSKSNVFNLAKLTSLKTLSLFNCKVSDELLFASIPDNVKVLNIKVSNISQCERLEIISYSED